MHFLFGVLIGCFLDSRVLGFHVAVSTMKKGEISRFLFKPTYFYGAMGCGQRIPPNCTGAEIMQTFYKFNGFLNYLVKEFLWWTIVKCYKCIDLLLGPLGSLGY